MSFRRKELWMRKKSRAAVSETFDERALPARPFSPVLARYGVEIDREAYLAGVREAARPVLGPPPKPQIGAAQ